MAGVDWTAEKTRTLISLVLTHDYRFAISTCKQSYKCSYVRMYIQNILPSVLTRNA